MAALSFPDGSFDAVLGFYSIIHLPCAEQTELLQKIARWLKPGGYLLANFAAEEMESLAIEVGLEVVVANVEHDIVDASFLWLIAKKQ